MIRDQLFILEQIQLFIHKMSPQIHNSGLYSINRSRSKNDENIL